MFGRQYVASGENLEVFSLSVWFFGGNDQIVVYLSAAGEANPLFQLNPSGTVTFMLPAALP